MVIEQRHVNKEKVLYIGGCQRSGSTIIGNLLNEVDGFFHSGEICYIWTHKPWDKYKCGCGASFSACSVWMNIFEHAFGSMQGMEAFSHSRPTSKEIFWKLLFGESGSDNENSAEYLNVLKKLYKAMREVTGCKVVVDSSKFPAHAYLLSKITDIELRMLHLVRDPRGTAFSWQKKIRRHDLHAKEIDFPRFRLKDSSLKWLLWNIETELLGAKGNVRYLMLRYEDFFDNPVKWLGRIIDFSGEKVVYSHILSGNIAKVGTNHIIVGNHVRGRKGVVELLPDKEWESRMSLKDRAVVILLTWPLLLRYRSFGTKNMSMFNV